MPKCTSQNQRSLCKYRAWASTALQAKCLVLPHRLPTRYFLHKDKKVRLSHHTPPHHHDLLSSHGSRRRAQNRSRKPHQRHRHGRKNDGLHEAQHPRTSSTSYARTSKPTAAGRTVMTPVRQSLPSLSTAKPVARQAVRHLTAINIV